MSTCVTKWSAAEIEEAIELALVDSRNALITPVEFIELLGMRDPDEQMPRFWKYLDVDDRR